MGLYGQYPYWETEVQIYNSHLIYMSERMRSTPNELLLAGARKMKAQFPFLAQIKCRYEPFWNGCLTLRVFAISGKKLLSLGFLSCWLRLVVFLWKWEKVWESYKDSGRGNNCLIQFIQLITQIW